MPRCFKNSIAILCLSAVAYADVPPLMNHQGVVTVNGARFTGTGGFRFAIVDPDTGINLWSNDGSITSAVGGVPTAAVDLLVSNGVYSVSLGNVNLTNMTDAIMPSLFTDTNVVLRIWFDDGTNGNQQLTPDHTLSTVPYADQSATAESLNVPGTSNDAVSVDTNGKVGIGTGPVSTAILKVGNDNFTSSIQVESNTSSGGVPLVLIRSSAHLDSDLLFNVSGDLDGNFGGPWPVISAGAGGTVSGRFGLYHGPSDARLKRNVVTIQDALRRVLAMRGVNFQWKDAVLDGDSQQMGMIAQEVEEVFPEAVHTASDTMGTKAIEYEHLTAALVEAIKELDGIVKQKDVELAGERKRIDALESRLSGLEALLPKVAPADRKD
jgi:Chaperone of endosialidase